MVDQQDNGGVVEAVQTVSQTNPTQTTTTQQPHALKKRKLDTIYTMQTISDSSDEGLGSMSPEPTTVTLLSSSASNQTTTTTIVAAPLNGASTVKQSNGAIHAKELMEMKTMLEMERRKNVALEDRLRQLTEINHETTTIYTNGERVSYEQHEVIEHTDNLRHTDDGVHTVLVDKVHHNMQNVHVLQLDTMPTVQTQVVMCSPIEHEEVEMVEAVSHMHNNPHIEDDDSRTLSPCDMHMVKEESSRPQSPIETHHHSQSNTIRLQPILEAAIKAEPKVEVERIHSPSSVAMHDCGNDVTATLPQQQQRSAQGPRMFITHQNTSRQNLETIVEAIRHLEGDQLFGEPTQEAPLALTNKPVVHHHHHQHHQQPQQQLHVEMNPFLHFRTTSSVSPQSGAVQTTNVSQKFNLTTANASITTIPAASPTSTGAQIVSHIHHPHHSINNRPGVIVVKQSS